MAKKANKIGEFGPIYTQFKNKPKLAIRHLKKTKTGEAVNALYRSDIGFIDIVWGENNPKTNRGFGLKHIIEKHGAEIKKLGFAVEDFIPIVIQFGDISRKKSSANKFIFESKSFRFVIQLTWNGKKKIFLLTAFDIKRKA